MGPPARDKTQPFSSIPPQLGFLWSIDEATVKSSRTLTLTGTNWKDDFAAYSFPPHKKDQFSQKRRGNLYRWSEGNSERTEVSKEALGKPHRVASLYFQPRQDNFVALSKDCTRHDLKKEGPGTGWCKIEFHHVGDLSGVDFVGERPGLAYPAKGSTLMPELLPLVYDCFESKENEFGGGLCGNLALLIGLAAFSTDSSNSETVVKTCFKMGKWLHHGGKRGIGHYEDRVVIVKIYLDPQVPNIKAMLKKFEAGEYGPILAALPIPPTSPSTQSTHNYRTFATRPLIQAEAIPRLYTQQPPRNPGTSGGSTAGSVGYSYSRTVPIPAPLRRTEPQMIFGAVGPEGPQMPRDEEEEEEGEYQDERR